MTVLDGHGWREVDTGWGEAGLLFLPGVCKNVKNVKTKYMYVYKKRTRLAGGGFEMAGGRATFSTFPGFSSPVKYI